MCIWTCISLYNLLIDRLAECPVCVHTCRYVALTLSAEYACHAYKDAIADIMPYVDIVFGNAHEARAYAAANRLFSDHPDKTKNPGSAENTVGLLSLWAFSGPSRGGSRAWRRLEAPPTLKNTVYICRNYVWQQNWSRELSLRQLFCDNFSTNLTIFKRINVFGILARSPNTIPLGLQAPLWLSTGLRVLEFFLHFREPDTKLQPRKTSLLIISFSINKQLKQQFVHLLTTRCKV